MHTFIEPKPVTRASRGIFMSATFGEEFRVFWAFYRGHIFHDFHAQIVT